MVRRRRSWSLAFMGPLRAHQRIRISWRRTDPSGAWELLINYIMLKERRDRRPDFIRSSQEEVTAGCEINQPGVRNARRGLSGVGQCPVQIVGRADDQSRNADSLERILPCRSLGLAFVQYSEAP